MQRKMKLIPAAILALSAGTAAASAFQLLEQNASGLGNAYAGSAAVADNASTIFFNPAGMTQLQPREISAGLTGVLTSYKFTNNGSSTGALTGNGGDPGGLGLIPNGYMSWALNKDLYVGVGFGAPFGLKTDYDNPWLGGAQAIKFDIKTYNINPTVAYRVNNMVSLGFGVDWQRMEAEYVRIAGINPAPIAGVVPVPLTSTTVQLKADDDSWGWNAGVLLNLSPSTKVGVSYRSSIKHKLDGSLTASGPAALAAFHVSQSGPATADIELPETFIVSATQTINSQWEMLGDISWTGWSSIDKVDVVRANGTVAQTLDTKFRDTWRVALGANYKLSDAWKLKFGTAYDQTPIRDPEHRLVSLPDNNRVWLSTGAQWKPNKASTLDLGITYLYVKDPDINNNQSGSLRGLVKGSYSDTAWIFGAQYSMSF
jgi:long-chain fatty acid transport protein